MRENSDGSIVAEIILVPICILRGHEIIFVGNCPHIDFFFILVMVSQGHRYLKIYQIMNFIYVHILYIYYTSKLFK